MGVPLQKGHVWPGIRDWSKWLLQGTGEGLACLGAIADYAEGAEGGEDEDEKHGLDERLVAFERNECYCRCHPKLAKGRQRKGGGHTLKYGVGQEAHFSDGRGEICMMMMLEVGAAPCWLIRKGGKEQEKGRVGRRDERR
jgi:hypothetical protein